VPVPADAPVWILYTSGSTGRPKGVVQTHRNVLHFVGTYLGGLAVTPEDQLALLFSCAVNAGCHEIWTALLGGAVLAERLGPEQPLWAFQARGLDGRQAPLSRVEGMAEAYLEELAVGCSPGDRMPWPATASARWWPSRWPGSSRPAGRWWRSWP
jgi:acyl-CoA synthetase (AMP-forming)/AMP-acid ligase II